MQFLIKSLNCRDKHYEFNITVVKDNDWVKFAKTVLLARTEGVSSVSLTGFKVIIRDNVAKFKIYWQDTSYHEFECHLNPYGRESKNYQDFVSEIWQNIMNDYYGEEYGTALETKLDNLNQTV